LINPNGPYPGRQLFVGLTPDDRPGFAYLVTGRSPESRERKAILKDNSVYMGPVGNAPYDDLRHYTAVKWDNTSTLLVVTNGIQTEAIYETYRLLHNVKSDCDKMYLETLMDGANSEPDSLNTPRISGLIAPNDDKTAWSYMVCLKAANKPARATEIKAKLGVFSGVATYSGDMENPKPRDPMAVLATLDLEVKTADAIAAALFDASAGENKGNDIRVCTVAGVLKDGKWDIAVKNVH
jgi:IMP cyclohydrolase